MTNNTSIYHTNRDSEPFRYLRFNMVYTIGQRNHLQHKLVTIIKSSIQLYSTRQLSLRGRVTVINTLIMTKIWHCLRLLQPTQGFLKQLQTLIYNFVWQKKPWYPLIKYVYPERKGVWSIKPTQIGFNSSISSSTPRV